MLYILLCWDSARLKWFTHWVSQMLLLHKIQWYKEQFYCCATSVIIDMIYNLLNITLHKIYSRLRWCLHNAIYHFISSRQALLYLILLPCHIKLWFTLLHYVNCLRFPVSYTSLIKKYTFDDFCIMEIIHIIEETNIILLEVQGGEI